MITTTGNAYYGGSYEAAFGDLPEGTVYSDPLNFKSMRADGTEDLRDTLYKAHNAGFKALESTSGGAGTAGYALVPVYLDPRVIDTTRRFTPLVEAIPRVTNMGKTADYNIITAKGGGYTAAEDAALPETNTTYDRQSTDIKYLYAVGRVTGQATATIPSYILQGMQPGGGAVGPWTDQSSTNAKQLEVLVKTRDLRELEEDLIVNGDAGSDATQFSGIITLMGATNTVDKNTSALTLDDLETAVRYAFDDGGRPTLAVASSDVVADIRKLLQDAYRTSPGDVAGGNLPFGIPTALTYQSFVGPITIIPSMYMSNTTGSKAIYFLDMSVTEMRVLQDVTYEDLAKTSDAEKFMLKCYEALIIKNTAFCSSVTEIA